MNEERFNEPFDDQDWLDIGADLRIKIRQEFNRIKKLKDQAIAEKDQRIEQLETRIKGMVLSLQIHGQNINVKCHIDWLNEALSQKGDKDE